MKINVVDLSGTLALTSADIYTLANANLLITADSATTSIMGVFLCEADGQTVIGTSVGGSSIPLLTIQPSYYPKAIMGAECGALVTSLDWANENLYKGYQYVNTGSGFFVSGVLNSTQTDANDPFTSSDIVRSTIACWKEDYSVTYNPFV